MSNLRRYARLGHEHSLNDLSDVVLTSVSANDVLQYNGTSWINAALSAGVTDHGALTGLADDDHPQYAGIAQVETITGAWTFDANLTMASDRQLITNVPTDATPDIEMGSEIGEKISYWGTSYGVGVEGGTLFWRTGTQFRWYPSTTANTGDGGLTDVMELSATGILDVNGEIHIENNLNISPTTGGAGQLQIQGLSYRGYVALDGTAMYVGHNSASRRLHLQVDETDVLQVHSGGVRIVPVTDVGTNTTEPAFMIGDALAANVAIDNNEIMARNNGAATNLNININGGNITLGQASTGRILISDGGNITCDLAASDDDFVINMGGVQQFRIDNGIQAIILESKEAIDYNDTFLRLNQNGDFSGGVYTPGDLRVDGIFRLDASRGLTNVTGSFGDVQTTTGVGVGNWEGYNIQGRTVFMNNGSTDNRLYNDTNNENYMQMVENNAVRLYYNSVESLETNSIGNCTIDNLGAALHHGTTLTSGRVTTSTSAPSGGTNGDVWFRY